MCIYSAAHIQHLKRSGRKSVSIWGCFSAEGAGALYRHERTNTTNQYRTVVNYVLMPFTEFRFENRPVKFVHDNSPIHKANIVRAWLNEHPQLNVLPWPAKGADMNPIENVWGEMVHQLHGQIVPNEDALWDEISRIWDNFGQNNNLYWTNLAFSMPKRQQMVLETQGGWTKY